jgi:hypothetical protein
MMKEVYTLNYGTTVTKHFRFKNKVCKKEKTFSRDVYS